MKSQQSGFTLIELIAVIVILGILAATAVPKFLDLSDAAEDAALKAIAGHLGSASALNHANNIATDAGLTTSSAVTAVANCTDIATLLEGGLDAKYTITAGTFTGTPAEGEVITCTVTQSPSGKTDTFPAHSATP